MSEPIAIRLERLTDSVTGECIVNADVTAVALAEDATTIMAGPIKVPHVGFGSYAGEIYAQGAHYIETTAKVADIATKHGQKIECLYADPSEATTAVACTPLEVFKAAAEYERVCKAKLAGYNPGRIMRDAARKLNAELADNRWHTEDRERYTLKPEWAAWKSILLITALSFATSSALDFNRHLAPRAYLINLAISAVISPICYFVVFYLPRRLARLARTLNQ